MKLKVESQIDITTKELVGKMSVQVIAEVLRAIAEKLDEDFTDRVYCAQQFEQNLSEAGARFLAEVVAQRFAKKK